MSPSFFSSLANQFLLAMPNMADTRFAETVVLICEHTPKGALGIIINKPMALKLGGLCERINLPVGNPKLQQLPVYYGGPVQTERGFVLHTPRGQWTSSLQLDATLAVTTSKDVLQAVAKNAGPDQLLVTLGYASWSAGQLERELTQNTWLNLAAKHELIFDVPAEQRFATAYQLLGINPIHMIADAGHA